MTLVANNVSVRFGGLKALSNASVSLAPGTIVGLVGPNGAGKTTLFNCLTGVVRPSEGSILLADDDISRLTQDSRVRRGISRTFQTPRVDPARSIRDAVLLGFYPTLEQRLLSAFLYTPSVREAEARMVAEADRIIAEFELAADPLTPAGDLSLGRLRMLEVARALAARPKYLLLDEPAAGVDEHELEVLARIIRNARDRGIGVLLVEHNVGFVAGLSEWMVALVQGEIVAEGMPDVVVKSERVMSAYLGASNVAN